MVIKITGSATGSNKGGCGGLVKYLEKENELKPVEEREYFFSREHDDIKAYQVEQHIDSNAKGLKAAEAKFYMVNIAPSEAELRHIGNDKEKLKEFTRSVMDKYAQGFGRGLKGDDLVWYAKIEENRSYKGMDEAVQVGKAKQGELKPGLNTHIHVIVSRKDAKKERQLSPMTNHRATERGAVRGGFDRCQFKQSGEKEFDKMFGYDRPVSQSFEYARTVKKGTAAERSAMKDLAYKDEVNRTLKQDVNKGLEKGIEKAVEKEIKQDKGKNVGWGMGFGM